MNRLSDRIRELGQQLEPEVLSIWKHLHQHPELSFNEFETSAFIQQQLTRWGIPFTAGHVKTGILGRIDGLKPGKTLALRADMDALPVTEKTGVEFASKNIGCMHACGHDVHMASLLGAAYLLQQLREHISGTVLLIFQPGEENLPGGARLMMDEGIFNTLKPDLIIGQHVQPNIPAGTVGFRPGMYMASSDEIYFTVKGKGGHGAMPHQLVDPVLITSHIIVALQQIVSRNALATIPTVLSFGKVTANGATNIIPAEVQVEGTFRTMNEAWRKEAQGKMKKMAEMIAESMGGTCEFRIEHGYPVLANDPDYTQQCMQLAAGFLGAEKVIPLDIRMTAEDFAYYSQEIPSVFYRLGVMPPQGPEAAPLHSATFLPDLSALKTGYSLMTQLAVDFLK